MASHSSSHELLFGAAKLCQDIATLFNNRQGSDVQFRVGGSISTRENGETIYDESTTVTLYAHSLILRCRSPYFVTLLDNDKDWKERSKCVIYKPNISPSTFQDVLHYIYTGNVRAKSSDNIVELIAIANEMGLEELSTECQSEFIYTIKHIFSGEAQGSAEQSIPTNVAIHTHIIPALNLANGHSLSHLFRELLEIMLPHMSIIIKSPDAYTSFISGVSSEALIEIIASDDLSLTERNVWDLALTWGCHQTKLSKTEVEARLSNLDDDDDDDGGGAESSDRVISNNTQLKQLKKILKPLLPVIRFSLLDPEDYRYISNILVYVLPRRRFSEINQFFISPDGTKLLDVPRKNTTKQKGHSKTIVESKIIEPKIVIESKIVVEPTTWELLSKNIFKTNGIAGCLSLYDLKFELLFRASDHSFLASAFHKRCDNNGPTLVIIKSARGNLFGGVNFNHWKSDFTHSSSVLNFLFALPDGCHGDDFAIFRIKESQVEYSSYNHIEWGPCFGDIGDDLAVADSANTNQDSYSNLPFSYNGIGASETTLAGSCNFSVSDYEVFAISKL